MWSFFSWVVTIPACLWIANDARERERGDWWAWALGALACVWIALPLYLFVSRAGAQAPTAGLGRDAISRADARGLDESIDRLARRLVRADADERGAIVREAGSAWADAIAAGTSAKALAIVRVCIESAAEAAARGEFGRAMGLIGNALGNVDGDQRKLASARLLIGALREAHQQASVKPVGDGEGKPARAPERGPSAPAAPEVAQKARPARAASDEREPAAAPAPEHVVARRRAEPTMATEPERTSAPAFSRAGPEPVQPAERPAAAVVRAPGRHGSHSSLAQLEVLSDQVEDLARSWLAAVVDEAPAPDRSIARVRLESAASAVYRGDFQRAIEMWEAAAALVPARCDAALTLRADLLAASAAGEG